MEHVCQYVQFFTHFEDHARMQNTQTVSIHTSSDTCHNLAHILLPTTSPSTSFATHHYIIECTFAIVHLVEGKSMLNYIQKVMRMLCRPVGLSLLVIGGGVLVVGLPKGTPILKVQMISSTTAESHTLNKHNESQY